MILCVGLATVDLVYRVARIPGVDEKAQATGMEIAAGGPAANAAVTAAALGEEVTLVTAIGRHPLGDLVRADLTACGVRLIDCTPASRFPPPVSAITVLESTGERTIVSRNAADLEVPVPPGGLPSADVTLVDGHHPLLAAEAARTAGRLLVDAGSWRPVFAEVLPHAEVVACSASFRHPAAVRPDRAAPTGGSHHPATSPSSASSVDLDAATAAAVGAPHVIVTHGADPVRWFGGGSSGSIAVPPVDAVDTAGAGDVFHGALAVALARHPAVRKPDLSDEIRFAIRVAGVRVAHRGPRSWISSL
jgi:sugar/nucleoside kinase (ribokinase family)